jgi:hypothetical protein
MLIADKDCLAKVLRKVTANLELARCLVTLDGSMTDPSQAQEVSTTQPSKPFKV